MSQLKPSSRDYLAKKSIVIPLWFLFAALLALILYNSLNRYFDPDEFEAVHTSWKILQGERIYTDFFQHHHPLFYYLLVPILAVAGESIVSIIAIRIFTFLMLVGVLVVTYLLAIRIFNRKIGIITVILLASSPFFIDKAIEIRPDIPQALFGLLSFLFLFVYFEKKSRRYLILSAVSLAVSFLFLQKAVFLIPLIAGVLIFYLWKKKIPWLDLLLYSLIFILVVLPFFLYLILNNLWSVYWTFNWVLNQKLLHHFFAWQTILYVHESNVLLPLLYILGVFLLLSSKKYNCKVIAFLSLGLLLSLFLVRVPYAQYLITAAPFFALAMGYAVCSISREHPKVMVIILVLSLAISTDSLLSGIQDKRGNALQLERVSYVLSLTQASDFIYDGDAAFNLFRKDIDFFWFSVKPDHALETYQTLKFYHYDIYELIDQYKPKVISVEFIKNIKDERIARHYRQSPYYDHLYIRIDKQ